MNGRTRSHVRGILTLLVVAGFLVGLTAPAAAQGAVVGDGTTFNTSADGPTITITEQLELNDSAIFPDDQTVDLSPNATFESSGATNATIDEIDGDWTNVTTHNVSVGLTVDPQDKQAVTVEGEDVNTLSFRDVDTGSGTVDVTYDADAEFNLTITDLPADTEIEAVDLDTGSTVATNTTDSQGRATVTFDAADRSIDLQEITDSGGSDGEDGGGGGGGGGGGYLSEEIATGDATVSQELYGGTVTHVQLEYETAVSGIFEIDQRDSLPAGAPDLSGELQGVVDISGPDKSDAKSGVLEVTIERSAVEQHEVQPADLEIVRYDAEAGDIKQLDARVVSATNEEITLGAEFEGFMMYGVITAASDTTPTPTVTDTSPPPSAKPTPTTKEVKRTSSTPTAAENARPIDTDSPRVFSQTATEGPGFGVLVAAIALLAAGVLTWRRGA